MARPSDLRVFLSFLVKTRVSDGWAITRKQSCSARDTHFGRMRLASRFAPSSSHLLKMRQLTLTENR